MKVVKIIVCSLFLLLATGFIFAQETSKNFADGELLVKFKKGVNSALVAENTEKFGANLLETLGDTNWVRVKLPQDLSVEQAIKEYLQSGEIESVQPNYYYHLQATPNDSQFGSLYGMTKISAPTAWDLTTGNANTVVAVIDTGSKYTHEDLAANIWTNSGEINNNGVDDDGNGFVDDFYGYDFFYNDSNPLDENGHGTHVSGTIGAVGNNALGVVGVNWNVRIMTIKIYDNDGYGTTAAMLINAYNYVRLMKNRGINIRVTNNSYSGCDEACGYDQATKDALDALGDAGVLNVFAAGNDARNIDFNQAFPASYTSPGIVTVASSNSTDDRSGFSNWGVTSVDIAAPGSGILSTVMSAGNYGTLSGTSMASPHTAGAAALLSSYNPNLSVASLKATLMNSADILSQWNGFVKSRGRLNIANALQNQTVCSFSLSSNSLSVPTKGGTFSVNVTASPNCDSAIKSNVKWIQLFGVNNISGNSTITFRVTVNPTISRTGTITIAGQTFTVNQSRS